MPVLTKICVDCWMIAFYEIKANSIQFNKAEVEVATELDFFVIMSCHVSY